MSKKPDAGTGKVSGFNWGGEPTPHYVRIGKERYPLTEAQWQRRLERLAGEGKR